MILIWKSFLEKGGRVNFLLSSENWGPIKVIINTLLGTTELSVHCVSLSRYVLIYVLRPLNFKYFDLPIKKALIKMRWLHILHRTLL